LSAIWYGGAAELKVDCSAADREEIRLLIDVGIWHYGRWVIRATVYVNWLAVRLSIM
jgi:hypothetical protein